ncbi:MAG: MFS transporter [Opitutaceae bacterium]|nr:MFS transporter [Opitutaceae bacterium]
MTFLARRLTDDARLIVLASTFGLLFTGAIGPFINYVSDRVWSPFGRRRPFVVVAYACSGIGLCVIPCMDSISTLLLAVACHACVHAFASPMEPLYMELVPRTQQGRAQAIRNAYIQASVLFFFQVCLIQFDDKFHLPPCWPLRDQEITGIQLTFFIGGSIMLLLSLLLACCVRERPPETLATTPFANPSLKTLLKGFPRDVFADWHWWPAYGLYVAPGMTAAVWGNLQPLMMVEQFGLSLTDVAQLGLPASLAGTLVIGPVLGFFADKSDKLPIWKSALGSLALLGIACWAHTAMPANPGEMPSLWTALGLSLPLGLSLLGSVLVVVGCLSRSALRLDSKIAFIVTSLSGQVMLAGLAWLRTQTAPHIGITDWLVYLILSQVFSLTTTVTLIPLLFSRIPSSRFGTVSSGFGLLSALSTYALGNLGGLWVHAWSNWQGAPGAHYTGLWLMQVVIGLVGITLVMRCLASSFMSGR